MKAKHSQIYMMIRWDCDPTGNAGDLGVRMDLGVSAVVIWGFLVVVALFLFLHFVLISMSDIFYNKKKTDDYSLIG